MDPSERCHGTPGPRNRCLNSKYIGNNALASLVDVSPGAASGFFKKEFGDHMAYKRVTLAQPSLLVRRLKELDEGYSPDMTYGDTPPGEDYDE